MLIQGTTSLKKLKESSTLVSKQSYSDSIDKGDNKSISPLFAASFRRNLEVLKGVVLNNANVNLPYVDGYLFLVNQDNDLEVVNLLLKSKADINKTNMKG